MLTLDPKKQIEIPKKTLIISEDSQFPAQFFVSLERYKTKVLNSDKIISYEFIGNDQAFKNNIIKLVKKYFINEFGKNSLADYNSYVDQCLCLIDMDVFSKFHNAKKEYGHFKEIINFLKRQKKIKINEEIIYIDFILLPSYPDVASFMLPFYNVEFDYFKEESNIYCTIECEEYREKHSDILNSGICCSFLLRNHNANIGEKSREINFEREHKVIFDENILPKALSMHALRLKEIYNTNDIDDFIVEKIENVINIDKIFSFHSCISLLFNN